MEPLQMVKMRQRGGRGEEDSLARKHGVRKLDRVLHVNGEDVRGLKALALEEKLESLEGTRVTIRFEHAANKFSTLAEEAAEDEVDVKFPAGLTQGDVLLEPPPAGSGAVVHQVAAGRRADGKGVAVGDWLVGVSGMNVTHAHGCRFTSGIQRQPSSSASVSASEAAEPR